MRQALADRGIGFDPGANAWERSRDRLWDRTSGLPAACGSTGYTPTAAVTASTGPFGLKISIEWNGYATHGTRSGFDHDSDKRATSRPLAGFTITRLHRPGQAQAHLYHRR